MLSVPDRVRLDERRQKKRGQNLISHKGSDYNHIMWSKFVISEHKE